MTDLTIDSEFKELIPPLSADEFSQLEENILRDGIQDPIKIWNGILIDGHNRYDIAKRHNLNFTTTEMNFANRDDAIVWIIKNQFGRRNLSAYDRSLLALKLKPFFAAKAKENSLANLKQNQSEETDVKKSLHRENITDDSNELFKVPQEPKYWTETDTETGTVWAHYVDEYGVEEEPYIVDSKSDNQKKRENKTNYQIAKTAGVSEDTIRKVEKIEQSATPEIKAALKSGDLSVNAAYKKVQKQEKIEKAKADIAAQHQNTKQSACLKIGDGIGYKPNEPYKLLLTDPPYSTDVDDVDAFAKSWLPNALNFVRDDGFAYVFIGAYPAELKAYLNIKPPAHLNLIQVLIWTYRNTLGNNPKDRYKLNYQACLFYRGVNAPALDCPITNEQWAVQDINAPDGRIGDRYHTWQKPMEIAERFIRHSTKCGDTVFDPFACTGTFLLAAADLGRNGYGFEINPDNAKIAFERGVKNGW